MDWTDMGTTLVNNPAGLLGSIAAFLGAGYAVLRKFSRSEKVSDATAGSQVDQIDRLTRLIEASDKRADAAYTRAGLADKRADEAFAERNEMMTKFGQMTEQINRLTEEVKQVGPLREEIKSLHRTIDDLRKQLNDKTA